MDSSFYLFLAVLALIFVVGRRISNIGSRESELPPGPKTIPVLGNLHLVPTTLPHYKFTDWARQFGGIYSLKIASGTIIVISDVSIIKDLIDKRSASSSDRPKNYGVELITGGLNAALKNGDTEVWRLFRKAIQTVVTPQSVAKHFAIIQAESAQLMYDLLRTPENFFDAIPRFTFSFIMSVTFGKRTPRVETKEAKNFFDAANRFSTLLRAGAMPPVDLLPLLKYLPETLWGSWKTACEDLGRMQRDLYFSLLKECEERLAKGTGNGCYMEQMLQSRIAEGMTRGLLGYVGGSLLEAGAETTASTLHSLVLCLVAFPDCLRKAQEEMDRVVGDRLPVLEDVERLPYLNAIIKEVHRFRTVIPLGVPHAMSSTQTCKGFVLPKDATVIINTWAIYHDPDLFEDPDNFVPERYLLTEYGTKPGVDDRDFRSTLHFGGGRRICPGIHLASVETIVAAMNFIWGFDFTPAIDKVTGSPIPVDLLNYRNGIVFSPQPFQCRISPRSATKAKTIQSQFLAADGTFTQYEQFLDDADREYVAQTRKSLNIGT